MISPRPRTASRELIATPHFYINKPPTEGAFKNKTVFCFYERIFCRTDIFLQILLVLYPSKHEDL